MKLSLSWLSQYVDLKGIKTEDLVNRLTMATCEVEEHFETFAHLSQLVVAEVKSCENHPDSDHLSKCVVFDGKTDLSVICGAANVRSGILIAFAPIGATLPTESGPLTIEKRKIRGVLSEGMICSAKELKLDSILGDNGGIIILDELNATYFGAKPIEFSSFSVKPKAGMPLSTLFPYNDTILDIDNKSITHRPDLWCHVGFAREVAAIYKRKLDTSKFNTELPKPNLKLASKRIIIEDEAAFTYNGLHCSNIEISDSPVWMKLQLHSVGQKLINNVVDASNYVLYELGQPNHCFDESLLKGNTIVCAPTKTDTKFDALDENSYNLPTGAVMIFDVTSTDDQTDEQVIANSKKTKPVALAGVIGGQHSSIQPTTQSIFIESATFQRHNVRRMLSAGAPRTESARRYEKGQDPAKAKIAVARIVQLLKATNSNISCSKLSEVWSISKKPRHNKISISLEFLKKRLGFDLKSEQFIDILQRLEFEVTQKNKSDLFDVAVPSFRSWFDVQIPEDLVEEIGRMYGYDNIVPIAANVSVDKPIKNWRRVFERLLKERLVQHCSYTETLNYSFASKEENQLFGGDSITLLNPVQAERPQMRRSQLPGLLTQASSNQDRFDAVSLFELGRVFIPSSAKKVLPTELIKLSFVNLQDSENDQLEPFLDHRRRFEEVLHSLSIQFELKQLELSHLESWYLHPGCKVGFFFKEKLLGFMGLAHPQFIRQFGI
ncbi:MAG: phenylalanine--tRNA ligase subunit beta, partial [Leptonema sp. (in: Bacteria)]|nr:phenylalanine--tRNA ligase subunit beta [Leptonema sp. (in: bacteria)]